MGTAKIRNASGNAMAQETCQPSMVHTRVGTMAIIASCSSTSTLAECATNQIRPNTISSGIPHQLGAGVSCSSSLRFCQIRKPLMGRIRNPWVKVSDRIQMDTIDQLVFQKMANTSRTSARVTAAGVRHSRRRSAKSSAAVDCAITDSLEFCGTCSTITHLPPSPPSDLPTGNARTDDAASLFRH